MSTLTPIRYPEWKTPRGTLDKQTTRTTLSFRAVAQLLDRQVNALPCHPGKIRSGGRLLQVRTMALNRNEAPSRHELMDDRGYSRRICCLSEKTIARLSRQPCGVPYEERA